MTNVKEEVEMSEDVGEADEDMDEGASSAEDENEDSKTEPPKAFLPGKSYTMSCQFVYVTNFTLYLYKLRV